MCEQVLGFYNDQEPELFKSRNLTTQYPEWITWNAHLIVTRVPATYPPLLCALPHPQGTSLTLTPTLQGQHSLPLFSSHLQAESGARGG